MNDKSMVKDQGVWETMESSPEIKESALWKERALKAEARLEALDWLVACSEEVTTMFPKMTMRTLGSMCKSIDLLRDAASKAK